tara:strand:+ start:47364 stop:48068 length:705 start_codon:yes stop_codon:yes gene_type:complete
MSGTNPKSGTNPNDEPPPPNPAGTGASSGSGAEGPRSDATGSDGAGNPYGVNNPYGSNASTPSRYAEGEIRLPPNQQRGMVGQVPIVGVLMMVQGVLMVLVAVGIALYAVFMPQFFEEMRRDMAAQGNGTPMPAQMGTWFSIGTGVVALVLGCIAGLTIVSGFRLLKYRGRTHAIVMLCCGMLSIATCYCFPTALALAVYGLIVLLSGPVTLAFDLSEQGYDPREIQKAFLMLP